MLKSSLCDYNDAFLLKEKKKLLKQELMLQQDKQIKEIKEQYLKVVLHLLNTKVK